MEDIFLIYEICDVQAVTPPSKLVDAVLLEFENQGPAALNAAKYIREGNFDAFIYGPNLEPNQNFNVFFSYQSHVVIGEKNYANSALVFTRFFSGAKIRYLMLDDYFDFFKGMSFERNKTSFVDLEGQNIIDVYKRFRDARAFWCVFGVDSTETIQVAYVELFDGEGVMVFVRKN
jgi:hypothetical protein